MKTNLKNKAIKLRTLGLSLGEIKRKLGISKSTASLWTSNVNIPKEAQNLLFIKTAAARKKGRETRITNLKSKYEAIEQAVLKDLSELKINKPLAKLLCSMLYWGEGSKSSGKAVFTNSDPEMISVFLKLFRYGFKPSENKLRTILHLHPYHKVKEQKEFWSKVTGLNIEQISIFHKKAYGKIVRENYPGCIAINCGNMEILHEIMYYYKRLDTLLGGFV